MNDFATLLTMFKNVNWEDNKAAVFRYTHGFCYFHAVRTPPAILANRLIGIEGHYETLLHNTQQFCQRRHATNALLWGARGCGKSSLVKAVCHSALQQHESLRIVEIESKDIAILPLLFDCMDCLSYFFIVLCDDLTFAPNQSLYHGLKSALDGSIKQQPKNILIYATSNLRHLMPEQSDLNMLHTQDCIHEMIALSDRFPLQIGFYDNGTQEYLQTLRHIIAQDNPTFTQEQCDCIMQELKTDSLNFATKIGNRNPRTAQSYYAMNHNKIQQLAKTPSL